VQPVTQAKKVPQPYVSAPYPRGLKNFSDNSYLNAILQSLCFLPPIREHYAKFPDHSLFSDTVQKLWASSPQHTPIIAYDLYKALLPHDPGLVNSTKDAYLCLENLLLSEFLNPKLL